MVIKEDNPGMQDSPDGNSHLKCHDCGESLEPGSLPAVEDETVCPACRHAKVHETLLYIKELLNGSSTIGKKGK
jgi:hypothetical protein